MLKKSLLLFVLSTAIFACKEDEVTVMLTTTVEGSGTIIPEAREFLQGEGVELTANPEEDWEFIGWSGDVTSTDNPLIISMTSNKALTATFTLLDSDRDGITDDIDQCPESLKFAAVDENGCPVPIYRNGMTVKAREGAIIGASYKLEGNEYTVVDETTLRSMVLNGEDVTKVVTTYVTNMLALFNQNESFNQDISSWDVSSVTYMAAMFQRASSFNQDIRGWDVSSVTDMSLMFRSAINFNQNLSSWNVVNVSTCENFATNASNWFLPKPNLTCAQ